MTSSSHHSSSIFLRFAVLILVVTTDSIVGTSAFSSPKSPVELRGGSTRDNYFSRKQQGAPDGRGNIKQRHARSSFTVFSTTPAAVEPTKAGKPVIRLQKFFTKTESTEAGASSLTESDASINEDPALMAQTEATDKTPKSGSATIPNSIITLSKSIVGASVLGLPAGMATLFAANAGTAATATATGSVTSVLLPALTLVASIGSLSATGFYLLALACEKTQSRSYQEAWKKTIGVKSSWMPALACVLVTACTVTTTSMILRDTLPNLFGNLASAIPALANLGTRQANLVLWTATVLLPLCLQRSLDKLTPFSFIGMIGMVYTALVMVLRATTGVALPTAGATVAVVANPWLQLLDLRKAAIFMSMLSTSFLAHYNAPKLYWELKDTSLKRFKRVLFGGFSTAISLVAMVTIAGFCTFGAGAEGMVLNSYPVTDRLITAARTAITLAVMVSYPLAFVGLREGSFDLMKLNDEQRDKYTKPATIAGVSLLTALALSFKDIRIISAIGGSTWGMCVMYLFPALMTIIGSRKWPGMASHKPLATGLALTGMGVGSMGIFRVITTFF